MVDAGCQYPYVTDSAGALLMHEARARFDALVAEVGGRGLPMRSATTATRT